MWVVAGALLGSTLLAGLIGLHTGPHTHLFAALSGLVAGGWLVAMALTGTAGVLVYLLLGADLSLAGGLGVGAWRALKPGPGVARSARASHLEGAEGVAVSPLRPEGVVRVKGEEWSARSLNGPIDQGTPVQVIRAEGVRLEVWGEKVGGQS